MEDVNSADVLSQHPDDVSDNLVTVEGKKCEVESTDAPTKDVESENGDADDEMIFLSKMKKTRKLAVSDSDDDDISSHPTKQICHVDFDQQLESSTLARAKQNKLVQGNPLNDSDDQSKNGSTDKVKRKRSRIKPVWISCSEDDDEISSNEHSNGNSIISNHSKENQEVDLSDKELDDRQHSHQLMRKKLIKKRNFNHDSDQENSSAGEKDFTKSAKKSKIKLASTLEEENEINSQDEHVQSNDDEESSSPFSKNLKLSPKEGMQKIQSESQRMVRESSVCLPYHKPKQRSLMDFLNRKRVTPSSEDRIKPRPRDLGAVVQVLEDRAKEVEEFFKSESEDSEHEQQASLQSNKQNPVLPTQELPDAVDSLAMVFINTEDISVKDAMECDKRKPPIADCSVDSQLVSREDVEMKSPLRNLDVAIEGNNLDNTEKLAFKLGSEIPKEPTAVVSDESNDSWLEYSTVFSHKEKVENIKRLSVAKVSKPTLHGRPGQLLDLDVETTTPDQKAKVDNLIERFVQQVTNTKKSPQKKDVQISIVQKVINADGQLELKKEVLSVPVDNTSEGQCASAGRRQLLKDSLRQSMSAKRAVDRMKKTENQKLENEDYQSEGKIDSEPEEEILSDDPDSELEDEEDDDEDERLYKEKRKKLKNIFVEEEAEDSDQENLEDDFDEEDTEVKTKLGKDQFDELEDVAGEPAKNEENFNRKESRVDYSPPARSELKLSLKSSGLFSSLEDLTPNLDDTSNSSEEGLIPKLKSTQTTESANVDELLALCSGKFPDATQGGTQKSSLAEKADDDFEEDVKGFSRIIPMLDDDDDNESCSGSNLKLLLENNAELESGIPPLFSDDEDEKSKPKKKKKRTRICLSDDEDGNEDEERSVIDNEEMHEEEREFRGLTDFFEDEAELSGSEVGSGDEREDGEDDWEEEEGDKEDIDENEVREQVGRAHMKTLLDQDQREVRLFQELFLEDGDLHSEGGGRQRQFRWKNADGEEIEGDGPRPNTQEEALDPEADDQDDLTWRKMRSEREKWLQQQKSQQEANKDVPLVMKRNGKTVKVNTTFKATLNPPEKGDTSAAAAANPKPHISPKKNMPNVQVRRGSFLRRSEKDLSALASLTKSVLPVQAPKMGSNFVFASITPERPTVSEEKRKFKLEGSKGESSNQNPAPAKKAKVSLSSKSIFSYF